VLGNLVNVPLRIGKPLAFLSDGTSVPGSLAPADARRVAEALLP
jgi:flagellar biosynthesis GTPase FlhF